MVGELNVWWPATRVSLLPQSSHSSVWRKAAFHMLVKMAGNLGVCSSAFLRPLSQKRQTSPTICRSLRLFLHRVRQNSTLFAFVCINLGFSHRRRTICTFCIISTFLGSRTQVKQEIKLLLCVQMHFQKFGSNESVQCLFRFIPRLFQSFQLNLYFSRSPS